MTYQQATALGSGSREQDGPPSRKRLQCVVIPTLCFKWQCAATSSVTRPSKSFDKRGQLCYLGGRDRTGVLHFPFRRRGAWDRPHAPPNCPLILGNTRKGEP